LTTDMVSIATYIEVGLVGNLQVSFEPSTMTSERSRRFEPELKGDFGGDLRRAIFSEMGGEVAGSSWWGVVVAAKALLGNGSEVEVSVVTSH